jgi:hypothetical protein
LKRNKNSKKTEITLDKYNNISTRKFKQFEDKQEALDKNLQAKVGNLESTVNVSLKNTKESLYSIISTFEMQIKDSIADNKVTHKYMTEKMNEAIKQCAEMSAKIEKNTIVLNNIVSSTSEAIDKKLTLRIDNLIEKNLKIPGVIDDPEGLNTNKNIPSSTLKDYILDRIEVGKMVNKNISVISIFIFCRTLNKTSRK